MNGIVNGFKQFGDGLPDNAIEVFMEWLSGGILKSLQGVQLPKDLTKWQDWVKFVASLAGVNPPGLATLLQASESDEEMPTLEEIGQLEYKGTTVKDVLENPLRIPEIARGYVEETNDPETLQKIVTDFLQEVLVKTGVTVATRIADWIAAATGVGAFKTVFNLLVTIYQRAQKIIQTALQVLKVLGAGLQAAAKFNAEDVAKVVQDGLRVAVKALLELVTLLLMLGGLINSIQETICKIITRIRAFVAKIIAWLFKKKKKSCKTGMCNMPGRGAMQSGNVQGGQSCTIPPKKGPMPMMKCGNCFIEGTPAKNGADLWQKLEEVVLGQRLRTWEPGELGYADSLTIPDTVIDPTTWRALWFVQEHADGYKVEVGMLRPLSWLEERGAEEVGEWVTLDLPEMGVEGEFQLMGVEACPVIEAGEGRVVLSVYRFSKGQTWNLLISGMAEPLGVTALHPIWSADRKDWVAVGELLVGERVLVSGGVQVVLGLSKRGVEKVYNVEVDGDHCYRVGALGLLVHNASWFDQEISSVTHIGFAYGLRSRNYRQHRRDNFSLSATPAATNFGYLRYRDYRAEPSVQYVLGDMGSRARVDGSLYQSLQNLIPVWGGNPSSNHAEQQLLTALARMSTNPTCDFVIIDIFTERSPCSSCNSFLNENLRPYNPIVRPVVVDPIPVYYVVPHGSGDAASTPTLLMRYMNAPYTIMPPN